MNNDPFGIGAAANAANAAMTNPLRPTAQTHRAAVLQIAELPLTKNTPPHAIAAIVSARRKAVKCRYILGAA